MTQPAVSAAGSGDVTPASPDPAVFACTLEDARTLLPNAKVREEVPSVPVTAGMVSTWIDLVAGEVTARIAGYERITDPGRAGYIAQAGRTIVTNGVAAYWERARTAQRSSGEQSHYQDLWTRYTGLLEDLASQVAGWLGDGVGVEPVPGAENRGVASFFPPPIFGDGVRW